MRVGSGISLHPAGAVDCEFDKEQLILMRRRVVYAPQWPAPAYEWAFSD